VKRGLAISAMKKKMGRTVGWGAGFMELRYMMYVFGLVNHNKTHICVYMKCVNAICEKVFSVCSIFRSCTITR
jgi:hypothetical protein